jgi:transposase
MTLTKSQSKNSISLYVTKSVRENGKKFSKVIEKLGTVAELEANGIQDPLTWAEEYVKELTRQEKEGKRKIIVKYSPDKIIAKGERRVYSAGYLFLQKIYHELRIDKLCRKIEDKYKFDFDLNMVMSRLVYGRILFPASKLATFELSEKLIEPSPFEIQHIYRGLEVIAKEMDFIQAELYKSSIKVIKRKTGVLYYDCTNYFFEIEQEEGLKQYAKSKENRPNPVVQMGLFMDGDGLPLAFCIDDGNTNEQITLKPLEKKILSDFELSKVVVCTDAGLSSIANRKYNNIGGRAFITTQSIKKLKKHLKEWALCPDGWFLPGSPLAEQKPLCCRLPHGRAAVEDCDRPDKSGHFNIEEIDEDEHKKSTFYKTRWINEDGLEQKLMVTYSVKYRDYQRNIRAGQIERAKKLINTNPTKLKKANQNDFKRFIARKNITGDGEVAEKEIYCIDASVIEAEAMFDGFYAVCTNLDEEPETIIKINHRRWEIEECFRIMKSEFKARPVYLKRDDRIKAHFTTCFISLLVYRILEKRLEEKFTCPQIIQELRDMNLLEIFGEGYVPAYTRTDFTDALHDTFGFRTDYHITPYANMKKIFKETKI